MREVVWVLAIAAAGGFAYWLWSWRRRRAERRRASEERFASFMAQALVAAKAKASTQDPVDGAALARQRLLLEAAAKAGEAGEPVLSIQLYARLLARYPQTSFAAQARAAVEAQKKKLAKA